MFVFFKIPLKTSEGWKALRHSLCVCFICECLHILCVHGFSPNGSFILQVIHMLCTMKHRDRRREVKFMKSLRPDQEVTSSALWSFTVVPPINRLSADALVSHTKDCLCDCVIEQLRFLLLRPHTPVRILTSRLWKSKPSYKWPTPLTICWFLPYRPVFCCPSGSTSHWDKQLL